MGFFNYSVSYSVIHPSYSALQPTTSHSAHYSVDQEQVHDDDDDDDEKITTTAGRGSRTLRSIQGHHHGKFMPALTIDLSRITE